MDNDVRRSITHPPSAILLPRNSTLPGLSGIERNQLMRKSSQRRVIELVKSYDGSGSVSNTAESTLGRAGIRRLTLMLLLGLFAAGTVLSASIYSDSISNSHEDAMANHAAMCNSAMSEIDTRIRLESTCLQALANALRLANVTTHLDPADFSDVSVDRDDVPFQTTAYAPVVQHADRPAIEAIGQSVWSDPSFRLTQWASESSLDVEVADNATVYYPAMNVDPVYGNQERIGINFAADPERLEEIERARDLGCHAISSRMQLHSQTPDSVEYMYRHVVPMYRPRMSVSTVAERRDAFVGIVAADIKIADLFSHLTSSEASITDAPHMHVFDKPTRQTLYLSPSLGTNYGALLATHAPLSAASLVHVAEIDVADRTWVVHCWSDPVPEGSLLLLASGLGLTCMIVLSCFLQISRSLSLHDIVAQRTNALATTNKALERQVEMQRQLEASLTQEMENNQVLLHAILPGSICGRLQLEGFLIADRFDEATIVFCDLVGFTQLSGTMTALSLVEMLNEIFTLFDAAVKDLGLEKIKTIGDAYMAVGGVPDPMSNHASAVCIFAMRILQEMRKWNERRGQSLRVRVGINTGPVVAGVIGTQRFHYDVWGDAVNIASRMESTSVPMRVQITPATRDALLAEQRLDGSLMMDVEPRGDIQVKGKGVMSTFFLNGISYDDNGYLPSNMSDSANRTEYYSSDQLVRQPLSPIVLPPGLVPGSPSYQT